MFFKACASKFDLFHFDKITKKNKKNTITIMEHFSKIGIAFACSLFLEKASSLMFAGF